MGCNSGRVLFSGFWSSGFFGFCVCVCVCVCVFFFFPYCDRCLKEEVAMAELGMGLIWMVGLEFWFF